VPDVAQNDIAPPIVPMAPQPSVPVTTSSQPTSQAKPAKEPEDPLARAAMALVGVDPDAEAFWLDAINDLTRPAEERKDLIEDLNENGFANGSRPGPQDLPLINTRIELIEELAPKAADQANADAFQEVHKDLVNMRAKFSGK
jgi:hypothetical protein